MTEAEQALAKLHPAVAWNQFFPNSSNRWDEVKVAHLYRRAAFGATSSELEAGIRSSPGPVIAELVRGRPGQAAFEAEVARLRDGVADGGKPEEFKGLWLYRMLHSPHPLRERMTLFWHNHFATSNAKVNDLRLMQEQNETLRRHALGHFDEMLQAMTRDPAMLVWLDSQTNKKGTPNENYAREIMELFSLGVDNYTERDIQEAARALTGWEVREGKAVFDPAQHDEGVKTILGSTGRWGAGDVVRICLAQDACSRFLVRKLFRFLVSETVTPTDEFLGPVIHGFRVRNYDIGWLVEQMISSWVFYSPAAIGQRVKSPVDFAIGTIRALTGHVGTVRLATVCDQLGQALYYPPSVKGWDGGENWINSSVLLHRQNLAFEITRGIGDAARLDPARLTEARGIKGDAELATFFLRLFHQHAEPATLQPIVDYLASERSRLQRGFHSPRSLEADLARTAAHLALTLPDYQIG
jgi:hypothetical protein